jgi:CRISPR-associated endonuclease/helicase Cas3
MSWDEAARPYELEHLEHARRQLQGLADVGLQSLPEVSRPFAHGHVLRHKDLVDLFDTTPDLAGNDIDIDRFVREIEESDVRVFWRAWDQPRGTEPPAADEPAPHRDELCPVPIGESREFASRAPRGRVWRWDFLERRWELAGRARITPGHVYLVQSSAGGYSPDRGWDPRRREPVTPVETGSRRSPDATATDHLSRGVWQTLAAHTDDVCREVEQILETLDLASAESDALRAAARWHDRGKAHPAFIAKLRPEALASEAARLALDDQPPAKAPDDAWVRGVSRNGVQRRHFRHELASALAVLLAPDGMVVHEARDLIAYLVAAHHGKVRLSIRSLPAESQPGDRRRFARGVWDGDVLPETDLGGGVTAPAVVLSLEPMELGLCQQEPFAGQPSWAERMVGLRDEIGPFRLAYLEAILRAADMRASRAGETGTYCSAAGKGAHSG